MIGASTRIANRWSPATAAAIQRSEWQDHSAHRSSRHHQSEERPASDVADAIVNMFLGPDVQSVWRTKAFVAPDQS